MKPSTRMPQEAPPVVSETVDSDTQTAYDQKAARRKGLLSTILSRRQTTVGAGSPSGNTTLG